MSSRIEKQPGPDHPITIEPCADRIVAKIAGLTVADTRRALVLREASYPPVWYIPREDVAFAQLERSALSSYCPYKGDCSYYGIPAGGPRSKDAVWSYEAPYAAVEAIRGHLAFYPNRVDFLGKMES
jgi:uncharacterized protein (DUF427 family)